MEIRSVQADTIAIEESRYNLSSTLFGIAENDPDLTRSLQQFGILSPVTLFDDSSGKFHIIDGFKRVRFALATGLPTIEAVILPASTGIEEMISMVLYDKRSVIEESVMNKVCFISYAVSQKVSEDWIVSNLCKILELKPHSSTLEECERISEMPGELKSFCHDKKFSLKQILNLTHYPEDLLMQLMEWRDVLQLTASVLDEIAPNLRDYLRSNDITIDQFSSEREIKELLGSDMASREKTERLRSIIRTRRYPVLTEVNDRIEEVIKELELPVETEIVWDRTLENKRVDIRVRVNDANQWKEIMKAMQKLTVEDALRRILDQL